MGLDINSFIHEHLEVNNYKNYCEALIYPDGTIDYAIPSHTQALENRMNLPHRVVMKMIPRWASPVHWMSEYLKIASIWYDFCILPKGYTEEQIETIKTLMKKNILSRVFSCQVSDEIERTSDKKEDIEYTLSHVKEVFELKV